MNVGRIWKKQIYTSDRFPSHLFFSSPSCSPSTSSASAPIRPLLLSELPQGKILNAQIADLVSGLCQNTKELVNGGAHCLVVGFLGLVDFLGRLSLDLLRPAGEVGLVLLLADVSLFFDPLL